jgi:hypothetical protein
VLRTSYELFKIIFNEQDWHYDIQYKDTLHNDMTALRALSITTICPFANCCYAECHYAECHWAECHYCECHYAESRGAIELPHLKIENALSQF